MDEFLDHLGMKHRAKVMKWIEQLEREGPSLPRPYADVVSGKIRELKRIIMTHGFVKKTARVPGEHLDRANRFMRDWLDRHGAEEEP